MSNCILKLSLVAISAVAGCSTADHAAAINAAQGRNTAITVGTVQRELRNGMTTAQVAETLGSPNMVTTDEERRENWVYDRDSTETAYSSSSGGVGLLVLGAFGSSGARSTSQRTLTIIVKFGGDGRVRDFAYRSSSF